MPELPEVETMRRVVEPIAGGLVRDVWRPRSKLRPILIAPRLASLRRRVLGHCVDRVERAGKRVVVVLDSGDRIVFEPRMTGRLLLADPPNRTHLRLVIELDGRPARQLLFWDQRGLGQVHLFTPEQFARLLGPDKLGPDALAITADALRSRLAPSRRAIKVALLDQQAVAGIGNIYASEILHRAGIHPETPCNRLRGPHWARLHVAVGEVLEEAVAMEGSTLSDGTYLNPRNEPGRYQGCHRVYQRAGEVCRQCRKAEVVRLVQAQRSTFFCPRCQKRRAR